MIQTILVDFKNKSELLKFEIVEGLINLKGLTFKLVENDLEITFESAKDEENFSIWFSKFKG